MICKLGFIIRVMRISSRPSVPCHVDHSYDSRAIHDAPFCHGFVLQTLQHISLLSVVPLPVSIILQGKCACCNGCAAHTGARVLWRVLHQPDDPCVVHVHGRCLPEAKPPLDRIVLISETVHVPTRFWNMMTHV